MALKLFGIVFGMVLILWGVYRMKKDDAFIGKTQTRKNLFNLLILGEASGLGQFLGGLLLVILGIVALIIK
ncbi:Sucrose-6-phosphate hydrolase [Bacillus cereus Rock4-18]|nr:Sucrose-6-phosphate hydrolase [Bacillus cereus Rock4-18]